MSPQPYGTWVSPITSALAAEAAVRFLELQLDVADPNTVYWIEQRSTEGGRCVVCSYTTSCEKVADWTPSGFNARTRVHEYGGGSFLAHKGQVYFSNFSDQRVYKQASADRAPELIFDNPAGLRYADGHYCDKHDCLYFVREDHRESPNGDASTVSNCIVVINMHSRQELVLVEGADFYSSPRVNAAGDKVCWMQWFHPNMPWDSTEVWIAELESGGQAFVKGSMMKVSGDPGVSVMSPSWGINDQLFYISDQTNWWNLYVASLSCRAATGHLNLTPYEEEVGGPHWTFGRSYYSHKGQHVAAALGGEVLFLIQEHASSGEAEWKSKCFATGYEHITTIGLAAGGAVYCIASRADRPTAVLRVDTQTGIVHVLRESLRLAIDAGYLSVPKEIAFPTVDGKKAFGYYYPPKNKDYESLTSEKPPLLVRVHGGPTSQVLQSLNFSLQYFTSRGFAVFEVNYRGSTGYGRLYRDELLGKWGICDVEDSCAAAEYLSSEAVGLADPGRLCIDGGSAGGFTTLACLAFRKTFKAGASLYGVVDLEMLAKDTHKFESRYLDMIVGPYPEAHQTYVDRSPLVHADSVRCPVIFFQGDEDKVVPPNQAEAMYEALKSRGVPCAYLLYKGEQHGFRKAETIQSVLESEFCFFCRVFNVTPAGDEGKLKITNLDIC